MTSATVQLDVFSSIRYTNLAKIAARTWGRLYVRRGYLATHAALMDIDMLDGDGETTTCALTERTPDMRILVFSMHDGQGPLLFTLRSEACGYLIKDAAGEELVDASRVVAAEDIFVGPAVAPRLATTPFPPEPLRVANYRRFSAPERTVLRHIAAGHDGTEIGARLGIAAETVDLYKQRIADEPGMTHRANYVRFARAARVLARRRVP